ncbi:apolipoprotein N-acyltransferase [Lapillicoccus jejuensis]|uniref:Apolipoprotein N-acyltransferase n=1 Tax=Lapillicoccus jejuensis TaxID=402171 RepID=A0A542E4Z9_9MICO|nr:apolipoprotein N-acyltransferase [Lapillicoccus jejuensis]TQJ10356.1 apolipoprotein N-acyltransferase [Lapillicoccus jejuensis]
MPLRVLLALLAGAALSQAFPGRDWWWLAPVGVALLALATRGVRARVGALLGLLAGLVYFLVTLHWSGIYVGDLPWIALSVSQAAFIALLGAAQAALQRGRPTPDPLTPDGARRGPDRVRPLVVALAWTTQELLRDRLPYGGFPWVRLAFSQSGSPFGHLAPLAGAPGITFAVALCGGLLAAAVVRLARRPEQGAPTGRPLLGAVALAGAVVVALAGFVVPLPTDGPTARVMAVQGNVPTAGLDFNAQRRAVLDDHVAATIAGAQQAGQAGDPTPDLVVWPENSSDIDPTRNPDAGAQIQRAIDAVGAPLVVGALLEQPFPNISNASLLYEPGKGIVATYVKQHPVPFAEYIPQRSFFRLFSDKVDLVRSDFAAGKEPVVFRVPSAGGTPIVAGPTICFEVAYDDLVRENVALGANLLLVQTNNATFGYTDESVQQLAISRIRAMELGRSVVHISTVGVSALITPDGTVHQPTSLYTRAVLHGDLPLRSARTVASVVGAWPEYAAGATLLVLLLVRVNRARVGRRPARRTARSGRTGDARPAQ